MTNHKDDRDATIDRLLALSPKLVIGGPSEGGPVAPKLGVDGPSEGGCLDADTLAAWADHALSATERAAAEAHVADCARCQAMLAAMAKTAPAPTAAASPWWIPSLRWLVPLTATAATAVLVWVLLVAPQRPTVRQVTQVADSSTPAQPPSLAEPPSPAAPPAADRERRAQAAPEEAKEAQPSRQNANRADDLTPQSATSAKADGARAEVEADKKSEATRDAPAAAESLEKAAAPAVAAPAAASPVAGIAARTYSFGAPETVIVSSNPASRWRILRGGAVQRSADGGATWQIQNTGVTDTLTAGASPSPSVCWLVGPRGIVLLSTDGRSWRRLAFPESVPLVSVSATDGEIATVGTADGRQFTTDDGGRTWTRPPG